MTVAERQKTEDAADVPRQVRVRREKAINTMSAPLPTDMQGKFAGQIQILGLTGLREQLGSEWAKFRTTIRVAIENIISTHTGPRDSAMPIGEDHYLMVFAGADINEAKRKSLQIAEAVRKVLLGQSEAERIKVQAKLGRVAKTYSDDIVFVETEPLEIPSSPVESIPPVKAPQVRNRSAIAKMRIKEEPLKQNDYDIGFHPIWNVQHEVMVGYAVVPHIQRANGVMVYEHAVLKEGARDEEIVALDCQLLRTQIDMAAELYRNAFATLLLSQIHYRTLSSTAGRNAVLEIARQVPPFLKKTLMVEINGIPENTPPSTIAQRAGGFSSFFRALTVRVPRLDYPVSDCAATSATVISFKVPEKMAPDTFLAGAKKLVADARKTKIMTSFSEVPDVKLAASLKEIGATFVTGSMLGGPYDIPGNMKRLSIKQALNGDISPY